MCAWKERRLIVLYFPRLRNPILRDEVDELEYTNTPYCVATVDQLCQVRDWLLVLLLPRDADDFCLLPEFCIGRGQTFRECLPFWPMKVSLKSTWPKGRHKIIIQQANQLAPVVFQPTVTAVAGAQQQQLAVISPVYLHYSTARKSIIIHPSLSLQQDDRLLRCCPRDIMLSICLSACLLACVSIYTSILLSICRVQQTNGALPSVVPLRKATLPDAYLPTYLHNWQATNTTTSFTCTNSTSATIMSLWADTYCFCV